MIDSKKFPNLYIFILRRDLEKSSRGGHEDKQRSDGGMVSGCNSDDLESNDDITSDDVGLISPRKFT